MACHQRQWPGFDSMTHILLTTHFVTKDKGQINLLRPCFLCYRGQPQTSHGQIGFPQRQARSVWSTHVNDLVGLRVIALLSLSFHILKKRPHHGQL